MAIIQNIRVGTPTIDVLILDDSAPLRTSLSAVLEDAGFSTRTAGDSREAFDVMSEASCQVLVADVLLGRGSPIPDGRVVAALAKQIFPTLGVVYVSGLPIDLGRVPTRRERILAKPFQADQLVEAVRALLLGEDPERLAA